MRYRRTPSVLTVFLSCHCPLRFLKWHPTNTKKRLEIRVSRTSSSIDVVFLFAEFLETTIFRLSSKQLRTDIFLTFFFQACTRKHPLQLWHRGRGREEITTTPRNRWKLRASCRVLWTRVLNSQTKHATEAASDRAPYKWQTIFDINSFFNARTFSLALSLS